MQLYFYILFIHSFIHEWNCSQSTSLCSTDSCGHLIFIDLSVTAGWSTQTTSNMSQSKHLHISSCCLNHSESSVQSSSTLSTNHPVYHHSNQKRKEEQTEVITEWLWLSLTLTDLHRDFKEQVPFLCRFHSSSQQHSSAESWMPHFYTKTLVISAVALKQRVSVCWWQYLYTE